MNYKFRYSPADHPILYEFLQYNLKLSFKLCIIGYKGLPASRYVACSWRSLTTH